MTLPKKILLVDYEPQVIALVRGALESTGDYIIKEEHEGRLAMNTARFFQPDLILFDILMSHPEESAIIREFQADPAFVETPVVFLRVDTTSSDGAVISRGILCGYSFLASSVRLDEFARYVAELLNPVQAASA